jgi:uncharacterized protein (TIGR02270 family)
MQTLRRTVESRLTAHLDALAMGGPVVAERALWPAVGPESEASPFQVSVAGLALLVEGNAPVRDNLLELLRTTENPSLRTGLASAFEVTPRTDVDEPLKLQLYATDQPAVQIALLDILDRRGIDPGPIAGSLLSRSDPGLLRATLHPLVHSAERSRHRYAVEALLAHPDPGVRGAALRAGLIWNLRAAWRDCPAAARDGVPEAMLALAQLGSDRELAPLQDALRSPALRRPALFALGFSGRRLAVDTCLPFVQDEDEGVAKLAGEAIAAMTGIALDKPPFAMPPKDQDQEMPPLEEDLATDLAPDPVEELPVPNAEAIRKWWSDFRPQVEPAQRYLRGVPLATASVAGALFQLPLRRVGALGSELAIRSAGRVRLSGPRLERWNLAVPDDVVFHRDPAWI